jgi:tetratricopeptide (TPR) repeat protein
MASFAKVFKDALPEGSLAARGGEYLFAALLPSGSHDLCVRAGQDILSAFDRTSLPDPLTGRNIGLRVQIGFALYPQNMDGLLLPFIKTGVPKDDAATRAQEQARHFLQRAGYAAAVAASLRVNTRIMPYGRIVHEGGRILRQLPRGNVIISLGRDVGAREGQSYAVWSAPAADDAAAALFKGELNVLEARHNESVAQVIQTGDPLLVVQPGDRLSLLPDNPLYQQSTGDAQALDEDTGFLRYNDFMSAMSVARKDAAEPLSLALLNINTGSVSAYLTSGADQAELARLAKALRSQFGENVLAGRFGHSSLLVCHPEVEPESLTALYEQIVKNFIAQSGSRDKGAYREGPGSAPHLEEVRPPLLTTGLAGLPFLHYRMPDLLECARKALEYAKLLPPPHVGALGTLALTISADKMHCLGDVFGAIEEYKRALLVDPDNDLAWNSLGVCMAGLGRHAEARRMFNEARARTPYDPSIAYNLGAVCLALGEHAEARACFENCLNVAPNHLFALVRLGQVAELRGNAEEAGEHYLRAAALSSNSSLPFRLLARLCLSAGNSGQAREHLHQALQRDPGDAIALQLMAQLYIDGGEDPALAESLARHSVALRPERKAGWLAFARALEQQGRAAEARQAFLRAGEL